MSAFRRSGAFAALFVCAVAGQQLPLEKRAIETAQRIPVSKLEPGLPKQSLVQWLTRAAGTSAKITWEVNDCGEQSGSPEADRGRDFPMCVDGIANLASGRKVIVSVAVGSFQKGITGQPKVWSVSIGKDNRFDPVPKLRDLPASIRASN